MGRLARNYAISVRGPSVCGHLGTLAATPGDKSVGGLFNGFKAQYLSVHRNPDQHAMEFVRQPGFCFRSDP